MAATEEGQSTSSKVAYCRKCGKKLLPDSLFCSYCGAEVIFEKNVCRFCGNELADGSVFCNRCGSKVSNDVQTAEAPQKPAETALQEAEIPAVKPKVTPPKAEETYIYDVAASGRMVRVPASQHAQWREMQDKIKNGTLSEQEKKALQDRQEELSKALIKSNGDSAPVSFNPFTQVFPDGTVQHLNVVRETDANMPLEKTTKERLFDQDPSVEKRNDNERKATNAIILYFAFIAIAVIIVIAVINHQQSSSAPSTSTQRAPSAATSETQPSQKALPLPQSGHIFIGANAERDSQLTIHSSTSESYYIKLKDTNNVTYFAFFVRPNSTVTVSVPEGQFYVYFASGTEWYGTKDLFGPNTVYSKDSTLLNFSYYTYEYTLYPVSDGNFKETIISADDF